MKILDHTEALQELTKATKRWGMYLNIPTWDRVFDGNWFQELTKAAPYLSDYNHQILLDESGYILFDSEEEMNDTYERTVGDDGPTKLNPYNGQARIYALTCSPEGELLNENT